MRTITRINDRCKFARAIVLFAALSFISRIQAAPVQWDAGSGGNGHYYEAVQVPDGVSWTAASALANGAGGYLATITSEAENNFVFALVDDPAYWKNVGGDSAGPGWAAFSPMVPSSPIKTGNGLRANPLSTPLGRRANREDVP